MNTNKEKPSTMDDVLNLLEFISLQQNTIKDQEKKVGVRHNKVGVLHKILVCAQKIDMYILVFHKELTIADYTELMKVGTYAPELERHTGSKL